MKTKEIRDLIDFISATGLEEVDIETEDLKIRVKRSVEISALTMPSAAPVISSPSTAVADTSAPQATSEAPAPESTVTIKSPMIGTFYRSPNPDSADFVKVGDVVKKGDTVCIIEAMKLFNEIESDVSGRIVEILVENSTPVEFDQPLFVVEPA
jgi:acetyl-CoA carboxylase biotin carboxyl carrier protein